VRAAAAALAALCAMCLGATYYVDPDAGDDVNAGTSEGAPLRTLAKVEALPLAPGDAVLLKRGAIFREPLNLYRSGAEGAPIVYGAYGEGDPPAITGADPVHAWTGLGDGLWSAPLAADPEIVFFDGALGARRAIGAELVTGGDWLYDTDAAALVVYGAAMPEGVEACTRHDVVNAYEVHDVTVRDLEVRNAVDAIALGNTSRVALEGLSIRDNAGWGAIDISADAEGKGEANAVTGCEISGTSATLASSAEGNDGCGVFVWGQTFVRWTRVEGSGIHDNGGHGVALMETSGNVVAGNAIADNGWSGVGTAGLSTARNVIERNDVTDNCRRMDDCFGVNVFRSGDDNVVRYNVIHAQHDTLADPDVPVNEGYPQKYGTGGIRFDGGDPTLGVGNDYILSAGNRAYYNVVYGEHNGIDVFNFGNVALENNVVWGSAANGVVVMTYNSSGVSVPGTVVRNNIVAVAGDYLLVHQDALDSTIDDNLYFPDGPSAFYLVDGADALETNLAGFAASTGFDAQSLAADPLLADVGAADFHPRAGSPAIDRGADVGLSEDLDGNPVPSGAAPDIGAYERPLAGSDAGADGGPMGDGGTDAAGAGSGCGCRAIALRGRPGLLRLLVGK
jgi:hypothetical protein